MRSAHALYLVYIVMHSSILRPNLKCRHVYGPPALVPKEFAGKVVYYNDYYVCICVMTELFA